MRNTYLILALLSGVGFKDGSIVFRFQRERYGLWDSEIN